jgi:hypothetical protein
MEDPMVSRPWMAVLLAVACAPTEDERDDDGDLAALEASGSLFPYEEPDPAAEAARRAERLEQDRQTILDYLQTRPELRDQLLPELVGTPSGDGNVTAQVNGGAVVLQGEGARLATVAGTIRRFGTVDNQLALYEAQLPLLPESCMVGVPSLAAAADLDPASLRAVNREVNQCWHAWRDQVAAPPAESTPPDNVPVDAASYEGAGAGSDTSGQCGPPASWLYSTFPHRWALSPVRSQGNRGSCVSFGVAGAMEYAVARRYDRFVNFSEQSIYAYGKFEMQGDHYGDGLSTTDLIEYLDDTDYAVPFEDTWPYNPSWERLICDGSNCSLTDEDDGDHYEQSCDDYNETCSDAAHQLGIVTIGDDTWWYRPEALDFTAYESVESIELSDFDDDDLDYAITLLDGGWGLVVSMDVTDRFIDGDYTTPGGEVVGGHAMQVANISKDPLAPGGAFVLLRNSWGCDFGGNGYATVNARYANEYLRALVAIRPKKGSGNARPIPRIESPSAGAQYPVGGIVNPVRFQGSATDLEDVACCSLEWSSNLDGFMGTGPDIEFAFQSAGTHVVTLTARDREGAVGQATVAVELENESPEVEITSPADGYTTILQDTVAFVGSASDFSEPLGFPCDAFVWTSSNPDDPFPMQGCGVAAAFDTVGTRTITVSVADDFGAQGSDSILIDIVEPDPLDPPTITVTAPVAGSLLDPHSPTTVSSDWTTQVGGLVATGFSIEYNGIEYPLTPSLFSQVTLDSVLPSDCGSQAATISAWITDSNGQAVDTVDVEIGWPPC